MRYCKYVTMIVAAVFMITVALLGEEIERPQVPWKLESVKVTAKPISTERSVVTIPAPSAISTLASSVIVLELALIDTSEAETQGVELALVDTSEVETEVVEVKPAKALAATEANYMQMIISAEDDTLLAAHLAKVGVATIASGNTRKLPEFLQASRCFPNLDKVADEVSNLAKLETESIKVVKFISRWWVKSNPSPAAYMLNHPNEKYVAIVDITAIPSDALKALSKTNVIAIIVGHFAVADLAVADYDNCIADIKLTVRLLRKVSTAPIILAVSARNYVTRRAETAWTAKFGDDIAKFDGWAICNLHNWAAILESPGNPRTRTLTQFGLPEKPTILLDFVGTPSNYPAEKAKYIKAVWAVKSPQLIKALKLQKWRGVIYLSRTVADTRMKAAAPKTAEEK